VLSVAAADGTARSRPGKPPVRTSGIYLCPIGFEYAAYGRYGALRRVYYPPFHPGKPPRRVRPARCYRSGAQARRVGYRLAPPPPGVVYVSGIYLVPPRRSLADFCRALAQRAQIPAPCPGLVPTSPNAVSECSLEFCAGDGYIFLENTPPVPPTYNGDGPGSMHLWFNAFRPGRFPDEPCPDGTVERSQEVRGRPGQMIACPPGSSMHSGHVVLIWEEQGVVYEVSLHGHTDLNRRLDAILAEHLTLIGP
jgi:hypothetical protein